MNMRTTMGLAVNECFICGNRQRSKYPLMQHVKSHNEVRLFCVPCKKSFKDMDYFEKHQLVHTDQRKLFRCYNCKTSLYVRRTDIRKHIFSRHQTAANMSCSDVEKRVFSCYECGKSSASRFKAASHHLDFHARDNKPPLSCDVCQRSFFYRGALHRHIVDKHDKASVKSLFIICCDDCGAELTSMNELLVHNQYSHAIPVTGAFRCSFCEKHLKSKHNFHAHLRNHTKDEPMMRMRCFDCQYSSHCRAKFSVHIMTHFGEKRRTADRPIACYDCGVHNSRPSAAKQHHLRTHTSLAPCHYCQLFFSNQANLRQHVANVHEIKQRKRYRTVCDDCGKEMTKKQCFLYHYQQIHINALDRGGSEVVKHRCKFCGKAFRSPATLSGHVERQHEERKPCTTCGKLFPERRSLKYHENSAHRGKRPILSCYICSRSFTDRYSIGGHVWTAHNEWRRNFYCDDCPKICATRAAVQKHWLVNHSGRKTRHQCSLCPKVFFTLMTFQRHQVEIHTNTSVSRRCNECKTVFTGRSALRRHQRAIHAIIRQCDACGKDLRDRKDLLTHLCIKNFLTRKNDTKKIGKMLHAPFLHR